MNDFPKKMYGRCPLGFNPAPSGDTGDNLSTEQIPAGEPIELFWSDHWQDYVCAMHKRRVADIRDDENFSEHDKEQERKRQEMGFINS